MTPRLNLSTVARRTSPPIITSLMQQALEIPGVISLAAGFVDQRSLPVEATARAIAGLFEDREEGCRALQYGTTQGDAGLRRRLIEHLERNERVPAGTFADVAARTVVTEGSQQLLALVAEALVDPGDIVLVEAPTYFVFLGVLESRGARVVRVATDRGGMRLDVLERTLEDLESRGLLGRVKLIYAVTEHANPTGISMTEDRRRPLVELARRWSERGRHRIFVLEDAAYRGLTFADAEPPSVWRHDREGDTVILARTFSKTFSPGFKTGYGILPESLLGPVLRLKGNQDFGSGHFCQQVLERLLADGTYERHVAALVALYRRKRDVMLAALAEHLAPFEGLVSWTRPVGGLFVWLTVPEALDTGSDGPLFSRALAEGVLYIPGAYAFADAPTPPPRHHARLCFGVPGADDLVEGTRRLAAALAACLDPVVRA
jgi:2-aminoadipate transaminase